MQRTSVAEARKRGRLLQALESEEDVSMQKALLPWVVSGLLGYSPQEGGTVPICTDMYGINSVTCCVGNVAFRYATTAVDNNFTNSRSNVTVTSINATAKISRYVELPLESVFDIIKVESSRSCIQAARTGSTLKPAPLYPSPFIEAVLSAPTAPPQPRVCSSYGSQVSSSACSWSSQSRAVGIFES